MYRAGGPQRELQKTLKLAILLATAKLQIFELPGLLGSRITRSHKNYANDHNPLEYSKMLKKE